MQRISNRTLAAQEEKAANERRMRQPANAAVLERAHFLNALFLRKSFSWTAVMMDLETVLPTGVQVTSIDPADHRRRRSHHPSPRLRRPRPRHPACPQPRALVALPRRRASPTKPRRPRSGRHRPPPTAVAPGGVEFEILANYNPLPPASARP